MINDYEFELIYNIDAQEKFYFDNIVLDLTADYDPNNFLNLNKFFKDLKNKPYSINRIRDIIKK